MLRPYKFLIVPVVQEIDEDGNVVQELSQENPTSVFGVSGLHSFADSFELELSERVIEKVVANANQR